MMKNSIGGKFGQKLEKNRNDFLTKNELEKKKILNRMGIFLI